MQNNSIRFFANRKREIQEQIDYWKMNLRSGILRFVERVIFGFNVSDKLAGNLEQVQHLDDVKLQISDRRLIANAQLQSGTSKSGFLSNLEASSPQYLFSLNNARVDILTGIVVLDSGFIVDSTLAKWQKIIYRGGIGSAVKRTIKTKEKLSGTHMVLPHSPYYFHILIDEIPNLIRIRDEYPACNSVIVNKSMPKWGLELLNYFGFSAILTSENTLRLERLLTVSAPRSIVKENLLLLRRKLLQTENKIVIVSRSGSPREDQVIENALKKYIPDSELVNPAELSVEEQVTLFSNAKIVIGLHGGGLSNIVWMHSAGKLIELFNHPYRTADYERVCVELGIGYFGLDAMDKTTSELISIVRGFVYAD